MTSLSTYNQLKENPTKDNINALVDQMFVMLDDNTLDTTKVIYIKYTVAAILHNRNYQISLSDLSRFLDDELNEKMSTKLLEKQTNDAIDYVTNLISPLNTYNSMPTIGNFISILESLEVESNIIRRFKFISSLSKDIPLPPHLPTLELVYTQQQVI